MSRCLRCLGNSCLTYHKKNKGRLMQRHLSTSLTELVEIKMCKLERMQLLIYHASIITMVILKIPILISLKSIKNTHKMKIVK